MTRRKQPTLPLFESGDPTLSREISKLFGGRARAERDTAIDQRDTIERQLEDVGFKLAKAKEALELISTMEYTGEDTIFEPWQSAALDALKEIND